MNGNVRGDLVIAVCALLISSLATGASWWQARVLQAQTLVLQEQLGAQVWPYVGVSENTSNDTVQLNIENDGLGPAILRSASATIDGTPKSSLVDVMHAILGPNLLGRRRHGEKMSLTLNSSGPGSVLRAGTSMTAFSLTSKRFAAPLATGLSRRRLDIRICYCAVIPGKCWLSDSASSRDPQPVRFCPEMHNDLLHTSPLETLSHVW